jgi:hypothetical protein
MVLSRDNEMTDAERQTFCELLRDEARRGSPYTREAADEIKRLVQERDSALAALRTTQKQYEEMGQRALQAERLVALAQSDAERREAELREDERLGAALRRAQDAEDRLAAFVQSDAEPVAWRWRENRYSLEQYGGRWQGPTGDPNEARWRSGLPKYTVEPLYAAPPRPDASAELIEADNAKLRVLLLAASKYVADAGSDEDPESQRCSQTLLASIRSAISARAADRSEK